VEVFLQQQQQKKKFHLQFSSETYDVYISMYMCVCVCNF
jgi:hypothetical protein